MIQFLSTMTVEGFFTVLGVIGSIIFSIIYVNKQNKTEIKQILDEINKTIQSLEKAIVVLQHTVDVHEKNIDNQNKKIELLTGFNLTE